ncbi:protein ELYS-like [Puntigrus tetrazona]|uniref:protein ELYS-like n=1 Tax=Puntigrus tetrazona TaxID=1606681 RepID=UPI001C89EBC6|nr:protein ELYS-like [Puntigrus tetrazona]
MCLDENSAALVHRLLLKLRSLLSLLDLMRKRGDGLRAGYEHQAIGQHIMLGRLVQWWSITGLLPKSPVAQEMKRISQMWCEMDQKHRRTCLELGDYAEDKYRGSSLIQGMVAQMNKHHGPIWVSEDCAFQTYPPPSLEALLKLVLLPNIDILSVQAIIMYFVLDVSNFLQCKDDLLQSFSHVFSIPSTFSQQICGFWLLDHRSVTESMNVLLSPRACPPTLSWHHCAVLRTLLKTGENRAALKYLYSSTPAMENIQDIKLCVDVLVHNKCISEAWALIRGIQTENVPLLRHFIHVCENHGISRNVLTSICEGMAHIQLTESKYKESSEAQMQETAGRQPARTEAGQTTPRPLSAWMYHTDDPLTPGDFVKILRRTISEICPLPKKRRVVLLPPKYTENSVNSAQLSSQASCRVASSTSVDILCTFKQRADEEECEEDLPLRPEEETCDSLPVFSSPDSMELAVGFFTSARSSPSAVCSEAPSAEEPTLLKQNSSAASPADTSSGCPDLTLTVEGTTEALSINSLSRESVGEIVDC